MGFSRVAVFGDVIYKLKYQFKKAFDQDFNLSLQLQDEILEVTRGILFLLRNSSHLEPLCGDHVIAFPSFQKWSEGINIEAFEGNRQITVHPLAIVITIYLHVCEPDSAFFGYRGNNLTRKRLHREEQTDDDDSSDDEGSEEEETILVNLAKKKKKKSKKRLVSASKRLRNQSGKPVSTRVRRNSVTHKASHTSTSWWTRIAK